MVFDELANIVDSMDVDGKKLGRRICVKMLSREGHTTREIPAYQPIRSGKKSL